jgi:hypothetical protein
MARKIAVLFHEKLICEGNPILLDANKTTGGVTASADPKMIARRRHRAEGLYQYFP